MKSFYLISEIETTISNQPVEGSYFQCIGFIEFFHAFKLFLYIGKPIHTVCVYKNTTTTVVQMHGMEFSSFKYMDKQSI